MAAASWQYRYSSCVPLLVDFTVLCGPNRLTFLCETAVRRTICGVYYAPSLLKIEFFRNTTKEEDRGGGAPQSFALNHTGSNASLYSMRR